MTRPSLKRNLLWVVLGMTLLSQAVFVYFKLGAFRQRYRQSVQANLQTAGSSLQESLGDILRKGIPLDRLSGLDVMLHEFLADVPTVGAISIYDRHGHWRYYGNRQQFRRCCQDGAPRDMPLTGFRAHRTFDLTGPRNQVVGRLALAQNEALISKTMGGIALDSITVILISMVAIIDLVLFLVAYTVTLPLDCAARSIVHQDPLPEGAAAFCRTGIPSLDGTLAAFHRKRERQQRLRAGVLSDLAGLEPAEAWAAKDAKSVKALLARLRSTLSQKIDTSAPVTLQVFQNPIMIRPALFFFVFAEALATSFMPLYAQAMYRPLWGFSREVIIGLPISAFMLFSAVSMPLAGALSDLIGRRRCFMLGAWVSLGGLVGCGLLADIVWLIVLRAMVGLGFGIVYMSAQGFIIDTTDEARRGEGMAMFLAALYAGSLCGTAIGGLIAERIGFQVLFLIGAGTVLAAMGFLALFVRETRLAGNGDQEQVHNLKTLWRGLASTLPGPRDLMAIIRNREFAALVILQSIPAKIGLIGLVFYTAPLMLNELGNSQADIGRFIIGYSLMMILLSQIVSRWSDRRGNAQTCVVVGGLFSGLVMIPFFWWSGTLMTVVAILGLGLAHTFVVSNQAKLASQLEVLRRVGIGGGMGLYTQCERVGNVLAPMVMGILVAGLGYARALAVVGAYIALCSLFYGVLQRTWTPDQNTDGMPCR